MRPCSWLQRGRARAGAELATLLLVLVQARNTSIATACTIFITPTFEMSDCLIIIDSLQGGYTMRAQAGFSVSPRRSRVQLSKNVENLKHKTRRVYFRIGQAHCSDHPVASPFSRTKRDKQHLIFILIDNFA